MRYSPLVSSKLAVIKRASEGSYKLTMLVLMLVEVTLLVVLVIVEVVKR